MYICRIIENIDFFVRMKKSRKAAQPHHGQNVEDFSQDLKNDRNVIKMKIFVHMLSESIYLFWNANWFTF